MHVAKFKLSVCLCACVHTSVCVQCVTSIDSLIELMAWLNVTRLDSELSKKFLERTMESFVLTWDAAKRVEIMVKWIKIDGIIKTEGHRNKRVSIRMSGFHLCNWLICLTDERVSQCSLLRRFQYVDMAFGRVSQAEINEAYMLNLAHNANYQNKKWFQSQSHHRNIFRWKYQIGFESKLINFNRFWWKWRKTKYCFWNVFTHKHWCQFQLVSIFQLGNWIEFSLKLCIQRWERKNTQPLHTTFTTTVHSSFDWFTCEIEESEEGTWTFNINLCRLALTKQVCVFLIWINLDTLPFVHNCLLATTAGAILANQNTTISNQLQCASKNFLITIEVKRNNKRIEMK